MACILNSEFWCEFIELYKSFPELWKIKSEIYKNKILKQRSYEKLLDKYKEIDECATVDVVKKKINNLRASYRRELKKITQSERSGCGAEEVHTPSLWYFPNLEFLRDQESQTVGISSETVDEDVTCLSIQEETPRKRSKKNEAELRSNLMAKAIQQLEECSKTQNDEESSYSSTWEHLFRKLPENQKLHANRLIMEVLFRGASGKLDEDTQIQKQVQPQQSQRFFQTNTPSPLQSGSSSSSVQFIPVPHKTPNQFINYGDEFQAQRPRFVQHCFTPSPSLTDSPGTPIKFIPIRQTKPILGRQNENELITGDPCYEQVEVPEVERYNNIRDVLLDSEFS